MIKKITLFSVLISIIFCLSAYADTMDYIRCKVLATKSLVIYFDAGSSENVVPGEKYELYYDGVIVNEGVIAWSDKNISRSEPLDSMKFAEIYYYDDLNAKIRLTPAQLNKGGYLTIPYYSDINLDPTLIETPDDQMVSRLVHRGILKKGANGKIEADLATTYEKRDLTYTFYLDNYAYFHSGKPVESNDVLYSLEKLAKASKLSSSTAFVLEILGAENFRKGIKNEISGIFLINNKSFSITLKRPFPSFLEYLAGAGGYVIPKTGLTAMGGVVNGAGKYKLKWRNNNGLALEPADLSAGVTYLDSVIFERYKNADQATLSMELGNIDLIPLLGESSPKFVSSSGRSSLIRSTNCIAVLGVNGERMYQRGSMFSKALSFLIDRETVIRVIVGDAAELPDGILPESDEFSSMEHYAMFPDSADYYFDNMIHKPEKINFYVDSRYPTLTKVARYIYGQLQMKGINCELKSVNLTSIEKNSLADNLDIYLTFYNPVSDNYDCILYPLFSNRLAGYSNYLYYNDDAFQTFLEKLRTEEDNSKKLTYKYGLARSIAEDPPALLMYHPQLLVIFKSDIGGFQLTPEGYVDLRNAYIEFRK